MTDHRTLLLVGGPEAGRHVTILRGTTVQFPAHKQASAAMPSADTTGPTRQSVYEVTRYETPDGVFRVLKPKGWSEFQVMAELLANYRPVAP